MGKAKYFECPNCNTAGTSELASTVSVSKDPAIKERILSGEYFVWECPSCQHQFLIDDVFLYNDDINGLMVYYVPGFKKPTLGIPTLLKTKDGFDTENSVLRVTAHFLDLAEKIRIFDAGLDDQAVEMVKFYLAVYFKEQEKDIENILFEAADEENLHFTVFQKDGRFHIEIPLDGYKRAKDDIARLAGEAEEKAFLMIDQDWIARIFEVPESQ